MTKFKFQVLVERDGRRVHRTEPEFIFGVPQAMSSTALKDVAAAIVLEFVGALQKGVRLHAGGEGIDVEPKEG